MSRRSEPSKSDTCSRLAEFKVQKLKGESQAWPFSLASLTTPLKTTKPQAWGATVQDLIEETGWTTKLFADNKSKTPGSPEGRVDATKNPGPRDSGTPLCLGEIRPLWKEDRLWPDTLNFPIPVRRRHSKLYLYNVL